jgi:glutaredoxin
MSTTQGATAAVPQAFWMPGCTSCLRMKEFMEKSGVEYEEVNVVAHPERAHILRQFNLGVPALIFGDAAVPGGDLAAVAALIGVPYEAHELLPAQVLKDRFDLVMASAVSLIGQLEPADLDYAPPDRDRTVRALSAHIATIMQWFVKCYEREFFENPVVTPQPLSSLGTIETLLRTAAETRQQFDRWWETVGRDDPLDRVLASKAGYKTLHELLERSVWHTAQHTRQLQYFMVGRLGRQVHDGLRPELLDGLPVPERIHN